MKILGLHKEKRDLADELLEGSNQSQKISEEDLLKLLDKANFAKSTVQTKSQTKNQK